MNINPRFDNVWDAPEDNPIRVENLKLRSEATEATAIID